MLRKTFLSIVAAGMMMGQAVAADLENTLYLELKDGRVVIETFPNKAPKHVARIKELAREGFYDGVVFHRVIDGFMAQTGDPTGTGAGGSDKPDLEAEFNDEKHVRGTVSMARAQNPNSANSQFFIMFDNASHLDGQYTAWGRVVEGMDLVDNIKKGDSGRNGAVDNPDKLVSLKVASDVKGAEEAAEAPAEEAAPEASEAPAAEEAVEEKAKAAQ